MKQKYAHIETLAERFFDGTTTNEEERELYAFFAGSDPLPEHLQEYKGLFAWFDKGIAGEIEEKTPAFALPAPKGEEGKSEGRKIRNARMRWIAAAASGILAVASFSLYTMKRPDARQLEGYIIRNGVKITDMDRIRPELEATMRMAVMQETENEQLFGLLHEQEGWFPAEAQVQQQYCRILSHYPDPVIRTEVEKMLNIECN